jgi:TIR domain
MTERSADHRDFFISRAGENSAIAIQIAEILRSAGYSTFIQDQDFGNTNFMARMADGFAMVDRGARVIAVLSPHYLKKEYCLAEAQYPLTGDPSNRQERLIVLRVSECVPTGFLKGIPYVDLVPLLLDVEGFARAVRGAVAPRGQAEVARVPGAQVLHAEIRGVPGFTGREAELGAVEAALWRKGGTAALTNVAAASAAVKGLGGVGKSVLGRSTPGATGAGTTACGGSGRRRARRCSTT